MRVEIKELHQRLGTTIVYVTHAQIEAMTMADKIVVMRDGRVEQIGSPLHLYDHPANVFVAGFIGSPAMNFVHGTAAMVDGTMSFVSDGGLRLPMPACDLAEGAAITYGIRPEHIAIGEGGVPMTVVVTEPTGSETQVFAKSGKDLIDAVVKDRIAARSGDEIGFVIDPSRVHLFDRETGARL
jgi:multiple sugar transport system ATP-binding protein